MTFGEFRELLASAPHRYDDLPVMLEAPSKKGVRFGPPSGDVNVYTITGTEPIVLIEAE